MNLKQQKNIFLLVGILSIFILLYLAKNMLTPFLVAIIISYFFSPIIRVLNSKYNVPTNLSALLILLLIIFFIFAFFVVLLPIIFDQIILLINAIPEYSNLIVSDFYPKISALLENIGIKFKINFSDLLSSQEISTRFIDVSTSILKKTVNSSLSLINIFSIIFIIPILIFYLLKDWEIVIKKLSEIIEISEGKKIKNFFYEVNYVLLGYIRGQFNVCIILGIFYVVSLSLIQLKFGVLIGIFTGLFSFIPYVGASTGLVLAILFALIQFGFVPTKILLIFVIFIFVQIVESNFLTPKLIGNKIGLHPLWIIFGLFFFANLFGFVGILLAMPLTAISGVAIRHFYNKLKSFN
jgi:predicted PurR-regulated permease PerM